MSRARLTRPGFTLLEILGVVALLAVAVGMGSTVLVQALRLQRQGLADMQRQTWRSLLADEFRSDVAGANVAVDKAELPPGPEKDAKPTEWKAGPAVLILLCPNKQQVIYRWNAGRLERIEVTDGKMSIRGIPVGAGCTGVEFVHGGAKGDVIALRLTDALGKTKQTRSTEIVAVLGGDLR